MYWKSVLALVLVAVLADMGPGCGSPRRPAPENKPANAPAENKTGMAPVAPINPNA